MFHPELRVGLVHLGGSPWFPTFLCSPVICASAFVDLTGPVLTGPCRLSQDVLFFSLSCRFSGAISLSTQTGTQGSSQPNAQNTGIYDTFWDLPRVFLRRNKVKSELANISLAFYSHDFHPHQTQRLSQYLCIFLSHCCGTATTPGK